MGRWVVPGTGPYGGSLGRWARSPIISMSTVGRPAPSDQCPRHLDRWRAWEPWSREPWSFVVGRWSLVVRPSPVVRRRLPSPRLPNADSHRQVPVRQRWANPPSVRGRDMIQCARPKTPTEDRSRMPDPAAVLNELIALSRSLGDPSRDLAILGEGNTTCE